MKTLLTTGAMLVALAFPAMATTIAGCEVVQVADANYFNKADPTCVMTTPTGSRVYAEGDSPMNPDDGNPLTANTVTVQDN